MEARRVLIAFSVAFAVSAVIATATTIRQVHTATSTTPQQPITRI